MQNYESAKKALPPGLNECCWGTWQVAILPHLEETALRAGYLNLGGPRGSLYYYDGANADVVSKRLAAATCPSDKISSPFTFGALMTKHNYVVNFGNTGLQFTMCVNYGGRNELTDAVRSIADDVASGRLRPSAVSEKLIQKRLYVPDLPDVDLFVRSSGEQRTSNFLLWQSAYAELVFLDTLFPDFDRRHLWEAVEIYAKRDRRFGGAVDAAAQPRASAPEGAVS